MKRIFSGVLIVAWCLTAAQARSEQPDPWRTVNDIEDVRLLWAATAYRVHELDTLLHYARDFGQASADPREARQWHLRALEVFEPLKSLDDGGQSLVAWLDYTRHHADVSGDVAHLRGLLGQCAADVLALYRDLDRRLAAVRADVSRLSAEKGLQPPAVREPMPWQDPVREAGRRMGFAMSWFVWMNLDDTSRQAALARQQQRDDGDLLESAAELGVRAIVPEFSGTENLPCCSWPVCEPEPGRYDFSRLDANIARLAACGLKVVVPVRSLTTAPPEWFVRQHGDEARLWRYDLKEKKAVPADGVNLQHEPTARAFDAYLAALIRHLREAHAERVLAVSLETSASHLAADLDYSSAARRHFQEWLRHRHADIGALNRLWGAAYTDFGEIEIPAPRSEPPFTVGPNHPDGEPLAAAAVWHDWIRWRKAWVAAGFERQRAVIASAWPNVPVQGYAIEANSHRAHSERPIDSWPLEALGTRLDLPGSMATVEPVQVLLRAVGRGRFTSQEAEQNFGSMLGGAAYSGMLKDVRYTVARNGPEMILRYFYSPGLYVYIDRQIGWDGAYSFRLKLREMNRLDTLMGNTRPAPARIAVLWSENSYEMDPTVYSRYGALGMAYALMCAKVHYDIVTETLVAEGALDRYDWLVIPEQRWLSDATLDRVRAYVERGGTLFATGLPGMFDEYGRPRGQPLADVFGADLAAFTPIQAIPGTYLVPTRPNATWDDRERGAGWRGHSSFSPADWTLHLQLCAAFTPRGGAEVRLRFADGSAALVAGRFGKGRTFLLGYPFGHEFAFSNTTEMSFGKLYPRYSYPPQMTELHRWLGEFVRKDLAFPQTVQVPQSTLARAIGREGSAPAMTYPGWGDGYEARLLETDEPNHSLTIGLRSREGLETTWLTVWNRDSAYAVGRGYAHFMAAPTHAVIRINRPDVRAIYDVLNRTYVPVARGDLSRRDRRTRQPADQDACVSFIATLPPYFGRVYAISTGPRVDVFSEGEPPGVSDDELVRRVTALAQPQPQTPAQVLVWDRAALAAWLANRPKDRPLVVAYGSEAWRPVAEKLAAAWRERGIETVLSGLGVVHETDDPDPLLRWRGARYRRELETIDVLIGNDWSNTNLADLSGAWQASRHANPVQPVSVNRVFPGGDRAVLFATRPFYVQDGGSRKPFKDLFHRFRVAPSMLVIGASSPAGAERGLAELLTIQPKN